MKFLQQQRFYLLLLVGFLSSCIGEDIIDDRMEESIRITTALEDLEVGTSFQLAASYFNEVGLEASADLVWVSSNESVISVNAAGLATAITEGEAVITVSLQGRLDLSDVITVTAGPMTTVITTTERNGTLQTTSTYALSGDFSLVDTGSGLELRLAENFSASSVLPDLVVYLANNVATNNGALELKRLTKFSGADTIPIPDGVMINDYSHVLFYCRQFSQKVGDGAFIN